MGAGGLEYARTVVHLHGEAIQCFEQVIHIIHNKIDEADFQGFIGIAPMPGGGGVSVKGPRAEADQTDAPKA